MKVRQQNHLTKSTFNFLAISEPSSPPKPIKPPSPTPDKVGESSRPFRNIPKKQHVSEAYIQPVKVEQKPETKPVEVDESSKKTPKDKKRKIADKPDESDESLLLATAELLNVTEVPKVENAQLSATFHNTIDNDKRNLPPKERNKRIRAEISRKSTADEVHSNNGSNKDEEPAVVSKPSEVMLPHKKKQSSRQLLTPEKWPVRESRSGRQETPVNRKKRKSTEPTEVISELPVVEKEKPAPVQSPLRDEIDSTTESNTISTQRHGQKRRISTDSKDDTDMVPDAKRPHKADPEAMLPRKVVACATESICINSKGQLSVERRDSLITTQANSVMVTAQVIINEATHQPVVTSAPSVEAILAPKPHIATTIKLPAQALKNAVKFPAEKLIEMKKQGLVTTGHDMKNKWTERGKQIFKEQVLEKSVEVAIEEKEVAPVEECAKPIEDVVTETSVEQDKVEETVEETKPEIQETPQAPAEITDESTNNNEVEKEPAKESQEEPQLIVENGKEAEVEPEVSAEDSNSGGAGLIALSAETFGGPPNCFYLCRQIDERYEPVDNQILVLNAQNALVPYEGEIATESMQTEVASENLTGYPQLSPNSNIILNTPNGQKIELDHSAILTLQEQADENGMASIELCGEQIELNIHAILEAINAQQEANEGETLLPGAVLIDGESAIILDTEMPLEMHHSATQVSETLTKPIMSTTIAPEIANTKITISDSLSKTLNIEDSLASIGVTPTRANVPKSLELPITVTNPTIAGKKLKDSSTKRCLIRFFFRNCE